MAIEPENGETLIDKWTVNYRNPEGEEFNGKLLLTTQNIYFEAAFSVTPRRVSAADGGVKIKYEAIKDLTIEKLSILTHALFLLLEDDSVHRFDRGMLSMTNIEKIIKQSIEESRT
ncbi:MAG: hypothetical protein JJT94_02015 [Bernardetiaceae bacterium]|nr:hypothetical protein [Bernardetiaceae bacterium]